MKILLIFRFFNYIWFVDSENLCFILTRKNDKVLNIVHFPNFEINFDGNAWFLKTIMFKPVICQ